MRPAEQGYAASWNSQLWEQFGDNTSDVLGEVAILKAATSGGLDRIDQHLAGAPHHRASPDFRYGGLQDKKCAANKGVREYSLGASNAQIIMKYLIAGATGYLEAISSKR